MKEPVVYRGNLHSELKSKSAEELSTLYQKELIRSLHIHPLAQCTNGSNTHIIVVGYKNQQLVAGTVFTRRGQFTLSLNPEFSHMADSIRSWMQSLCTDSLVELEGHKGAVRYIQPICSKLLIRLKQMLPSFISPEPLASEMVDLYDEKRLNRNRLIRGRIRRVILCNSDSATQDKHPVLYLLVSERIGKLELLYSCRSIAKSERQAKAWATKLSLAYSSHKDTCLCLSNGLTWITARTN